MEEKAEAGARFFQTQAIYEARSFVAFINSIHHLPVTIIVGVMPIKSVKMAQYANKKNPGIHIPEWMIQPIANADDVKEVSIQLAAELISELAPLCGGVHLMAQGAEDRIPLILDRAMT